MYPRKREVVSPTVQLCTVKAGPEDVSACYTKCV